MGDAGVLVVERRRGRRDGRWVTMWLFVVVASCAYHVGITVLSVLALGLGDRADQIQVLLPYLPAFLLRVALAGTLDGLLVGLPVALVLTFLVGDGRGPRARRTAMLAAASTHAVAAAAFLVLIGYVSPHALLWLGVLTIVVALIAGRWHDRLASRPREEPFYAD